MCRRTTRLGRSAWPLHQTVDYLLELLGRAGLINPPFTASSSQIVSSWLLSIMVRSLLCDLVAVDVSGLCRARDDFTVMRIA
jgi:hypothetical protein